MLSRPCLGAESYTVAMAQSPPTPKTFDALIVGSGATGGWAAKQLTETGLEVALLEAGPKTNPDQFSEHVQPYEMKYRDAHPGGVTSPEIVRSRPMHAKQGACSETNYKWFANDVENPFTTPKQKPFVWVRVRALGGRTLAWGRQTYRLSDLDFKAAGRDGHGADWPLSYKDLAPYYSQVERYIGVSGRNEALAHFPDGEYLPPMRFTCGDRIFKDAAERSFKRPVTIGRTSILTKAHNGRAACHYCGPCNRGCVTYSYFSSPFTTITDAQQTGRLTLITDAVVSHITTRDGLASGVAYIDRTTRAPREIRAKVVILCASTLESTRILLNSAPGGLANSSGVLGHYLMDHMYGAGITGRLPQLTDVKPWKGAPRRANGIFVPRFRNVTQAHTNGTIRGFSYQGGSTPQFALSSPGFGASYKQAVHSGAYWQAGLHGFVEGLSSYNNYVELDRNVVDAWGIPVLRISMQWSDNERALFQDCLDSGAEMLETAGTVDIKVSNRPKTPGDGIHEVGTARMGADPKRSVLNQFGQTHDVKNLFVTDGAAFPSLGSVNPTLTMMAVTTRACDYLVEAARKGELG